ncbi:MAG: right-handed parallel beta-helix repeat-containing protein, partial [Planctomycetota bacterium]
FAQLFVDGQRRFRPVVPAEGWYTIAATLPPTGASAKQGHDRFAFTPGQLRPEWTNLTDVEVVVVHRWTMSRISVGSIDQLEPDPAGGGGAAADSAVLTAVTLAGHTRGLTEWCSFPKGNRFRAENVREGLGSAGSWYLDRPTGTLTYCPLPGETPETAVVVAPVLDTLVEIRGDHATGRPVEHVRFEGVTFAHGNWTLPQGGQSYPQAEINVGAAVALEGARHIAFRDVAVMHVGRYAVGLGGGCRECILERSELVDLGGGGVLVGTTGGGQSWDVPGREGGGDDVTGNVIRDCSILHGGRLHPAAVGVWIGHASHTTVEHCEIADLTYTGVSVGWNWGYAPTRAHHNRILRNRIHHLGHGVLSDMGGVYTLGVSPGTVVEGNVIHDITSHDYGGWGLYTDEGSTGIVLRNNLVYRTSSGGFHQHYGRDNTIENNVFAAARDWQLQRTKVEDHTSFVFRRNLVWWNSAAPLVHGDWTKGLVTEHNGYWNAAGPVRFPGELKLADRQAAGQDEGSIEADPKFAAPEAGDFTLAPDSPALALGFVPLEPEAAGRRTPRSLTAELPPVPTSWPEARGAAGLK